MNKTIKEANKIYNEKVCDTSIMPNDHCHKSVTVLDVIFRWVGAYYTARQITVVGVDMVHIYDFSSKTWSGGWAICDDEPTSDAVNAHVNFIATGNIYA